MSRKKRRPPSEKKALSYARDRRNCYGENDKASRRLIPLRKAKDHRSQRRGVAQSIAVLTRLPEEAAAVVEGDVRQNLARKGGWRKGPDARLADVIRWRQEARVARAGRQRKHGFVFTPATRELHGRLEDVWANPKLTFRQRRLAARAIRREWRREFPQA